MLVEQMINPQIRTIQNTRPTQTEVNRLLAAALISKQFCNLLLKDPARALQQGFAGEHFSLSSDEQDFILSLHVASLQEFIAHVCDHLSNHYIAAQASTPTQYNEGNLLI